MQASLLLLTATTLGVDFGYQPMDDADPKSSEYIIQLQPHEFDALQRGVMKEYVSYVPAEARPVGRIKIVVGSDTLPRVAVARPVSPPGSDAVAPAARRAQHVEPSGLDARGQSPDPRLERTPNRGRPLNTLRQPNLLQPDSPRQPARGDPRPAIEAREPRLAAQLPARDARGESRRRTHASLPPFAAAPRQQSPPVDRGSRPPLESPRRSVAVPSHRSSPSIPRVADLPRRPHQPGPSMRDLPPFAAHPGPPRMGDSTPSRPSVGGPGSLAGRIPSSTAGLDLLRRRADDRTGAETFADGPLLAPPQPSARSTPRSDTIGMVPIDRGRPTAAWPTRDGEARSPQPAARTLAFGPSLPPFASTPHPSKPPGRLSPASPSASESESPHREKWIPELRSAGAGDGLTTGNIDTQETVDPIGIAGWILVVAGLCGSIGANFLQLLRNVSLRKRYLFLLRRTGGLAR